MLFRRCSRNFHHLSITVMLPRLQKKSGTYTTAEVIRASQSQTYSVDHINVVMIQYWREAYHLQAEAPWSLGQSNTNTKHQKISLDLEEFQQSQTYRSWCFVVLL
jgi:hypothetical protein